MKRLLYDCFEKPTLGLKEDLFFSSKGFLFLSFRFSISIYTPKTQQVIQTNYRTYFFPMNNERF
jgi:hypothetical protein